LQAAIHAISGKVLFQILISFMAGSRHKIRFAPPTEGCLFHLYFRRPSGRFFYVQSGFNYFDGIKGNNYFRETMINLIELFICDVIHLFSWPEDIGAGSRAVSCGTRG